MTSTPERLGFIPGRLDRLGEHLSRHYIEPGKIAGCQVLVARAGEVAYARSFGHADLERRRPMAEDTLFRIYSMTKPITSVALMMLYEQGYFSLNDPVQRLVPEWRNQRVWVEGDGDEMRTVEARRPPNFRDMLCHTGGLTYGNALADVGAPDTRHPVEDMYERLQVRRWRDQTLQDFVKKLGQVPLRFQPGEHFMYSYSTDVCAALVELLSGQRFDVFLKEKIFDPLGMVDTAFWVPPEKQSRLAACYARNPDKTLRLVDDPERSPFLRQPSFFSGGAGLVSSLADYHRFCEMLRRGGELAGARILGPRTLEFMRMNHLRGGKHLGELAIGRFSETNNEGVGFGLGFASVIDPVAAASPSVGDYYWGGAASTLFWVDPNQDLVVIFLTQLTPSRTFDFRGQLKSLIYAALAR